MTKEVAVVSLGCDKNRIDTEHMLSYLVSSGYGVTANYDEAEIIIVNTCAFIEAARKEAIDTILEMAQKKKVRCKKLIVTGCLPQKYSNELSEALPEVDAFLGVNDYDSIVSVIESYDAPKVTIDGRDRVFEQNRVVTTPNHYAYVTIADGCDNFCTFCTIPSIRGKYRSRSMESIIAEVRKLAEGGTCEIILVAQDTTRYGIDLYGRYALTELLHKLSEIDGIMWLRLMYCYPELVSDELLDEMATNEKIAKYIDIPMQHYDDGILKLMNRRCSSATLDDVVERTKQRGIAVRTTFMVGFPTETEEQFDRLCEFARRADLTNVGIFAYSAEEDTPSAKLRPRVPRNVKLQRVKMLGEIHLQNARKRNAAAVGSIVDVLYEDIDYDRNMFVGRTMASAPDVDGVVYFTADFVDVGNVYKIRITDYDDYDLIGEKVS